MEWLINFYDGIRIIDISKFAQHTDYALGHAVTLFIFGILWVIATFAWALWYDRDGHSIFGRYFKYSWKWVLLCLGINLSTLFIFDLILFQFTPIVWILGYCILSVGSVLSVIVFIFGEMEDWDYGCNILTYNFYEWVDWRSETEMEINVYKNSYKSKRRFRYGKISTANS